MLPRTIAIVALGVCLTAAPGAATLTLSIIGTNDVHGGVLERDGRGGLAALAGYVANVRAARARDGGGVLLLDAGDMFQGTLESNLNEGAIVVTAYNALGYAAAAIGNHEFDFGPVGPAPSAKTPAEDSRGALKARAAQAKFPFLAANLIDTTTGRRVDWPNVRASTMVTMAGVKVGVVGLMTSETLATTLAANTHGLAIAPLSETLTIEADKLRSEGATVIVVTAHAGGRCRQWDSPTDLSSCDPNGEIFRLVKSVRPGTVDAIVAGHTHAGIAQEVLGVPIVESFSTGTAFGRIDLDVDRASHKVTAHHVFRPQDLCTHENPRTHRCDASGQALRYEGALVAPDAAIARLLQPAIEAARTVKAALLGVTLDTPLKRGGAGESALGNLFTDAYRQSVAGADVAINNTDGGLRADIPAGPLTYGSLFEVFPFDNRLVSLPVTGADLRRLFAGQAKAGVRSLGVSGLRVQLACEPSGLSVTMRRPSGAVVTDAERLTVVTTDFLATGGDGIFSAVIPRGGYPMPEDAPLARDVVADALRRRGGHARDTDFVDAANPRWPAAIPSCGR